MSFGVTAATRLIGRPMLWATQPAISKKVISFKFDKCLQLTCNVSAGTCWTNYSDDISDVICELEVAVDEVADLDQDPRPVDAIDRAEVMLRHVVRVTEHSFDGNIKIVGSPVNSITVNITI